MTTNTARPPLDSRATCSLIFGLGSWVGILPVIPAAIAVWCGVTARRRIGRTPGARGGRLAVAGTVLGVGNLVTYAVLLIDQSLR